MDAIIILGAAVWANGPSPTLRRRTEHAVIIWRKYNVPIIPCGGLGKHPPTEAAMMRKILVDAGVPAADIRPEDQSTNTFENIRNALPLLPGRHVVIVTDHYHGRRAAMVARHFGLDPVLTTPAPNGPTTKAHIREYFARFGYRLKLWCKRP